ncbi:hypothetical protein ASG11_01515 [Sphingomonas sp. Leaf357]|uniref:hypothetical protein n=1 Tax=Sphingomonas sp. Leaf357 TaxID=1736350 RepID=UPI0006FDAB69|nr:hypothetical protein [Sphingomonas sp. Leaf357]KQS03105.1 hypothetical protein ASG11_01515 [Sphingomonas sp. Leaf357]
MSDTVPEDLTAATMRALAQMTRDALMETQKALLEEHSAIGRWLSASLLAVNGAGALAIFNAIDRLEYPKTAGLFFVAGAFCALLVGVFNQRANRLGGVFIGEALARSTVVSVTGDYNEEHAEFADTMPDKVAALGRAGPLAGWASAILFGLGALAVGVGFPQPDLAQIARCAAIQRDMLSATPLRRDGKELFSTLGCKPHGEGSVHVRIASVRKPTA